GCSWNVDMTIERIPEEGASFFLDADDSQRQSANLQCFSNRILVREELLLDVASEHNHECGALYFIIRDEASGFDGLVFDVDHVRRAAENDRAGKLDAVLLQISARAQLCPDFGA